MEWTNFSTGIEGSFIANFSSDKLKLHNFDLAEDQLKESLKLSGLKNWLKANPVLIMHQPGDAGRLSPLELRALREVGYSAGAINVYIWQGHTLNKMDIENEVYKNT